jgi:hypothetical protein
MEEEYAGVYNDKLILQKRFADWTANITQKTEKS